MQNEMLNLMTETHAKTFHGCAASATSMPEDKMQQLEEMTLRQMEKLQQDFCFPRSDTYPVWCCRLASVNKISISRGVICVNSWAW